MGKRKERAAEDDNPEYETVRKKNIERNRAILSALDIEQDSLPDLHAKNTKSTAKPKKSKKKEAPTDTTASRRSLRDRKEVITYNDEELSREAEKPRAGSYVPPNSPAGMKVILQ
jgi:hypothetical protein